MQTMRRNKKLTKIWGSYISSRNFFSFVFNLNQLTESRRAKYLERIARH